MSYRIVIDTIRTTERSVLSDTFRNDRLRWGINSSDMHFGVWVKLHASVLIVLGSSHLIVIELLERSLLVSEDVDVKGCGLWVELGLKLAFRNNGSISRNHWFLLRFSLLDFLVLASEVHHCAYTHNCHDEHNNYDNDHLNSDWCAWSRTTRNGDLLSCDLLLISCLDCWSSLDDWGSSLSRSNSSRGLFGNLLVEKAWLSRLSTWSDNFTSSSSI